MIAAALERGIEVVGELELAWRALPNRFLAVTGTNGKTTTVELLGHVYRGAGEPVAVAGNVGTPLAALVGEVEPDATVVCECSSFQLEDTSRLRPRVRGLPQPRPRPPRPPRRPRGLPGGEAADLRQPGQRRRRRLQRRRPGRSPASTSAAAPAASPSATGPAPTARSPSPRARSSTTASRCSRPPSSACSASTTSPTRWPPPRRRSRWASTATRCARACAASPASRTGSSRSPRSAASASSTTPRRPTSPPPRVGLRAFEGGVHAILGGSEKGEPFAPLLDPVRERCAACYLIGASADRLADELAPAASRPGSSCTAAPTSRTPSAAPPPRPRPGEVVLLSPACASFDAFENFEQRGERFREIVGELR